MNRCCCGAATICNERGVRVRFIGRRGGRVPKRVVRHIEDTEALTAKNRRMTLTFAFNYGGRAELTDAVRSIAREVAARRLRADAIDGEDDREAPLRARHARSRISSCGPRASSESRTICSGRARTRSTSSPTSSGPTSAASTSSTPSASFSAGIDASEVWNPTRGTSDGGETAILAQGPAVRGFGNRRRGVNDRYDVAVCGTGSCRTAATFERRVIDEPERRAATAIALVDDHGAAGYLFIRRALDLRRNPGQYAAPGWAGRAGGVTEATARRELAEELGVTSARIRCSACSTTCRPGPVEW